MAFFFKILVCCLAALGSVTLHASSFLFKLEKINQDSFKEYKDLLENSTWIVPPQTLLAFEYTAGTETPVEDQTVWIISEYENGYFFGKTYPALNGIPKSIMNMVGTVTPFGDVYITFYPTSGSLSSTDIVTGLGTLTIIDHQYVFVMQMNSSQNNLNGLTHWSYMISVNPNDYFYQHLPSLNLSVPEFISLF